MYPAPILSLYQMNDLKIAGIKYTDLKKEAQKFCDLTQSILNGPLGKRAGGIAQFIKFDGKF